jgi:hypothetical protein
MCIDHIGCMEVCKRKSGNRARTRVIGRQMTAQFDQCFDQVGICSSRSSSVHACLCSMQHNTYCQHTLSKTDWIKVYEHVQAKRKAVYAFKGRTEIWVSRRCARQTNPIRRPLIICSYNPARRSSRSSIHILTDHSVHSVHTLILDDHCCRHPTIGSLKRHSSRQAQ